MAKAGNLYMLLFRWLKPTAKGKCVSINFNYLHILCRQLKLTDTGNVKQKRGVLKL